MFAEVILDTKSSAIDRPFSYRIPEELLGTVKPGSRVNVPFGAGNTARTGWVVGLTDSVNFPEDRIKPVLGIPEKSATAEEKLMELAIRIRHRYGGTLSQAMSVVIPNKTEVAARKARMFAFIGTEEELLSTLSEAKKKKYYARIRLLEAFTESVDRILPGEVVTDRLNITAPVIKWFTERNLLEIRTREESAVSADVRHDAFKGAGPVTLNEEQGSAVLGILTDKRTGHLLYGITGSGKTEVYLHLISEMLKNGREVIVLIPEIALTYQTVMRFYDRFGEQVSVVHSRLSKGEKCERFERAANSSIKVMIGPRSALFTPFKHLGMIIIDEFHETSYLSDQVPKYNTVEVALERAKIENADLKVILGSATPSVSYFDRALAGEFGLWKLSHRAVNGSALPEVETVDLREELKNKNRSIFSMKLQEKIRDRLEKGEQIMLFLNRRGYSGSVSCRNCGEPVGCPHCSVPLHYHKNGTLKCHFCGFERPMVKLCPKCSSNLIGTFGIGTERVEEMAQELFPGIRTLRMDADTTAGKDGHQEILSKFANGEADVLIGTQMIVKGHDFPKVTLVGILAADLSLNIPDYRSAERTFQLLVQAEGRAGRGARKGECIIQTYDPSHYAVSAAASQDYEAFFETEMLFRRAMHYPPAGYFMTVRFSGQDSGKLKKTADRITGRVKEHYQTAGIGPLTFMGPVEDPAFKVKDQFRYLFHFKTADEETMLSVKHFMEDLSAEIIGKEKIFITFEN